MKFNFKTFSMLLAGAALGLTSCSSEEPAANSASQNSEGDFYTTLTLNFGNGTRSATTSEPTDDKGASSDGEELAILSEYNIDEILVVLCTQDETTQEYTYVTHALASAVRKTNTPASTPTYVVRFETQDLYDLAGDKEFTANSHTEGALIHVFTYCNPTDAMKAKYDPNVTKNIEFEPDGVFTVDGTPAQQILWKENNFVMTNAGLKSTTLPSKYDLLYSYNKETTPFSLGTVTVQRIATRFDLASKDVETVLVEEDVLEDGTVKKEEKTYNLAANQYAIMDPVNNVVAGFVTMDGVSFFNEAKNYYAFMHTSNDGSAKDWTLCGVDNRLQYVVSPYWETTSLRGNSNFNYSLVDGSNNLIGPDQWEYDLITDITDPVKGREDQDETWGGGKRDYYFWKYSTPNTIPGGVENQIKGNTTGILFRAYITPNASNTDLVNAMNAGEEIYAFEGKIYGNTKMLAEYVAAHPQSQVQKNACEIFNTDNNGNLVLNANGYPTLKQGKHPTQDGGFTVYKATDVEGQNVYYCYYYYYNRHNDNGNDTDMGLMEFAAVRNNVYKLFVSSVKEFGHTGDPNDDEKPEDPNDPDESRQTYFKVQVEVLPWVVRVNDINF